MADSDCAECKYNHNYGGKCPYDEYDCVFYPLDRMTDEEVDRVIAAAEKLEVAFDAFIDALGDYDNGHVNSCAYEINNIMGLFNRENLAEYKRISSDVTVEQSVIGAYQSLADLVDSYKE